MCETFNCLSRPHNMQVATQGYLSNQTEVTKSSPESTREVSGVVLLWAGGARAPQYFAQTIVKVGFGPPQYLRQ